MTDVAPNPSGLCMCGCGQTTRIATHTARGKGWVKGEHLRFVHRHQTRSSQSHAWEGGTKHIRGRELTYVGREHPMAGTQRYVLTHRLVMAEKLGRMLTADEHVHHVDLDHTNNDPENLVLLDRRQHKTLHCLVDKGVPPDEALRMVAA